MKSYPSFQWTGALIAGALIAGCGGSGGEDARPVAAGTASSVAQNPSSAAAGVTVLQTLDRETTVPVEDEAGITYVNNLVRLHLRAGTSEDTLNTLLQRYNAVIANRRGAAGMMTLALNGTYSADALQTTIAAIAAETAVADAAPLLIPSAMTTEPDDPWEEADEIDWDEEYPYGNNWGLEMLHLPGAWDYNKYLDKVSLGVVDLGFYEHDDLHYAAPIEMVNFKSVWDGGDAAVYDDGRDHGTHAAGSIAALWNGAGITGIVQNVDLYTATYAYTFDTDPIERLMAYDPVAISYALALDADSVTETALATRLEADRFFAMNFFADDLNFTARRTVLVVPAGNGAVNALASSQFAHFNYIQLEHNETMKQQIETLRPHIVIVGGVDDAEEGLDRNNYGEAIDIYAPAVDILSTVGNNTYAKRSGTSTAVAYVTGILGMIYGANPQLSAKEAKELLIKGGRLGGTLIETPEGISEKYVANAKKSVELALYFQRFTGSYTNDLDGNAYDLTVDFDPIAMTLRGTLIYDDLAYPLEGTFELSEYAFEEHGEIEGGSFRISLPSETEAVETDDTLIETAYFDVSDDTLKLLGNGIFPALQADGTTTSMNIEFALQPGEAPQYDAPQIPIIKRVGETITITSPDAGVIYYAFDDLNASEQIASFVRYSAPFTLEEATNVYAVVFKNGVASAMQTLPSQTLSVSSSALVASSSSSELSSEAASERPAVSSLASSSASSVCIDYYPLWCNPPERFYGTSHKTCSDYDGDYVCNSQDNCPDIYNPDQTDINGNGWGDECESTGYTRPLPSSAAASSAPERPNPSSAASSQVSSRNTTQDVQSSAAVSSVSSAVVSSVPESSSAATSSIAPPVSSAAVSSATVSSIALVSSSPAVSSITSLSSASVASAISSTTPLSSAAVSSQPSSHSSQQPAASSLSSTLSSLTSTSEALGSSSSSAETGSSEASSESAESTSSVSSVGERPLP